MTKTQKARASGKKGRARKKAAAETGSGKMYRLRLYITGQTRRSLDSIRNIRQVCEEHLAGRFQMDVIDIYQQPELAKEAQIVAAPTLVKSLPAPLRRLVGDLSNQKQVLIALNLKG